jgi:hypothetical protein
VDTLGYPTPVSVTSSPVGLGPNVNYVTLAIQNTGGDIELTLYGVPTEKGVRDVRLLQPFAFSGSFTWGAPIQGFECVAVNPSAPGIVSAQAYLPGDPAVPGGAFSGVIVSPTVLINGVTGIVESGGDISAGSGFIVEGSGGGSYTIEFTPILANTPAVVVTPQDPSAVTFPVISTLNAAGFMVTFFNLSEVGTPSGFSFVAIEPQ